MMNKIFTWAKNKLLEEISEKLLLILLMLILFFGTQYLHNKQRLALADVIQQSERLKLKISMMMEH